MKSRIAGLYSQYDRIPEPWRFILMVILYSIGIVPIALRSTLGTLFGVFWIFGLISTRMLFLEGRLK